MATLSVNVTTDYSGYSQDMLDKELHQSLILRKTQDVIFGLLDARAKPKQPAFSNRLTEGGSLCWAVRNGHSPDVVDRLIQAKAGLIQASDSKTGTLEKALEFNCNVAIIRLLIGAKADVNEVVLKCASDHGASPEVMQILNTPVSQTEEVSAQSAPKVDPVKLKNDLQNAVKAQRGDDEILSLLAQKAEPTTPNGLEHGTLHRAILKNRSDESIKALLKAGAKPSNITLVVAIERERSEEIIKLLLDNGATLNRRDDLVANRGYSDEIRNRLEAMSPPAEAPILRVESQQEEQAPAFPLNAEYQGEGGRSCWGCIAACFGGIWNCIYSIFSGIARLFSGAPERRERGEY